MAYAPVTVAKEFARLSESGETHMKLQKLVYMVYGEWLKNHEEPLISEPPQVWQYGPVFDSLYHCLKSFRSSSIPASDIDCGLAAAEVTDPKSKDVIGRVWERYKDFSGPRLSDITHLPGTPWHQVAVQNSFRVPMGTSIPDSIMKKWFRAQNLAR